MSPAPTCAKLGVCRLHAGHAGLCVYAPQPPMAAGRRATLIRIGAAPGEVIVDAGVAWIAISPEDARTAAKALVDAAERAAGVTHH